MGQWGPKAVQEHVREEAVPWGLGHKQTRFVTSQGHQRSSKRLTDNLRLHLLLKVQEN